MTQAWAEDHEVFRKLVEWMQGAGRFAAMSLKQIRMSPQQFIDTGWPMFQASQKPKVMEQEHPEAEMARRVREWEAEHATATEFR